MQMYRCGFNSLAGLHGKRRWGVAEASMSQFINSHPPSFVQLRNRKAVSNKATRSRELEAQAFLHTLASIE
jgi:hypothetical protein